MFEKQTIHWRMNNKVFSSVQSLSRIRLFVTPWIAACQASLSITNSRSSLKLMSIKLVMPSIHLILCHCLLLLLPIPPSIRVFSKSQLFMWGGQSTGVSALASFLPKNTQDWSPLEWTGCVYSHKYILTLVLQTFVKQMDVKWYLTLIQSECLRLLVKWSVGLLRWLSG